jgi:hypothetical protein
MWRREFGGIDRLFQKKLKGLEKEDTRLKKIVAQ